MNLPTVLGLTGGALGILGGVIGTYFGIRNTKTPAERRLMIRASIWIWLVVGLFLAILYFLPSAWRWVAWLCYGISFPLGIRYINNCQRAIRELDRST